MTARSESSTGRAARNLADLVAAAAARRGAAEALRFRDRSITWAELDRQVSAFAAALLARGHEPGERVALAVGNRPEFAAAYFGCLRAGLVAVPTNTGYTPEEMAHQLADAGCSVAVCDPGALPAVSGARSRLPALREVVAVDAGAEAGVEGVVRLEELLRHEGEPPPPRAGAEDLAVLLYTSGTSGRPKGAMLSHRALLANLDQVAAVDPPVVRQDDVVLLVLPLFHVYGLNTGLGLVARTAATGLLVERFEPVETLTEMRRHGVTTVVGAPPMYVAWSLLPEATEVLGAVRMAVSGAAALPPAVAESVRAATGRPVYEGYGLTETAPVLTLNLCSDEARPGSIGRPLPGVELRLVGEDGREPEDGDPGEIVVRGANLFSGYWPDGSGGPDVDGWFATGDVAVLDEHGDLRIIDRRRELVIVSGFNVYPREVEAVLATHPDIEDVAVTGVPHPYTGETVKAFVVAAEGSDLSVDDVIEHAARSLARFKCPTVVEFVDELPRLAIGKLARGRLRGGDPSAVS